MEIGKEGIGPLENVEIDMEAFIEAMNRAIIDSGLYKNALEMVDLPRRYVEESIRFEPQFEKHEFRRIISSPPVITESMERIYVRSNSDDR